MNIVMPFWQWIMENRLEIERLSYNWLSWRISKIIPVTPQMRAEAFLSELRRYLR